MSASPQAISDILVEIETRLDVFYNANFDYSAISFNKPLTVIFAEAGVGRRQAHAILQRYLPLLKEVYDVTYEPEKDAELTEAYGKRTKQQLKDYSQFVFDFCGEIRDYMEAKPEKRKKKIKSAKDLTQLVQWQKEDTTLKIRSIDPSEIIGAIGLLCYNTKYQTVALFLAKPNEALSFNRTTLINFDEGKSLIKILDSALISRMMTGNFQYVIEYVKNHPYTPRHLTGRIGSNTLLLRVFK
jgi:predicted HTH transcriptional regulator